MLDPDLLLAHEQGVWTACARRRTRAKTGGRHMPMASIEPVGRYWAVGERVWVLSQSAKRAFGCHGRRCFAKQRVSDPVLTCCSPASPHPSRGHPRHGCGSACSCRLAKRSFKNRANCAEASSEEVLYLVM